MMVQSTGHDLVACDHFHFQILYIKPQCPNRMKLPNCLVTKCKHIWPSSTYRTYTFILCIFWNTVDTRWPQTLPCICPWNATWDGFWRLFSDKSPRFPSISLVTQGSTKSNCRNGAPDPFLSTTHYQLVWLEIPLFLSKGEDTKTWNWFKTTEPSIKVDSGWDWMMVLQ